MRRFIVAVALAAVACGGGAEEAGETGAQTAGTSSSSDSAAVNAAYTEWRASMDARRYDEAAAQARAALAEHPDAALAHFMVSRSAYATADRATMLSAAREAVRRDASDARFFEMLALGYQGAAEMDSAEMAWRRVAALRPDDAHAWLELGRVRHIIGQHWAADSAFRIVDSLMPLHFDTAVMDMRMWLENNVEIRRAHPEAEAPMPGIGGIE